MRRIRQVREKQNSIEEANVSKIIKDLGQSFGGSNEEQMKGVQLLKGLATSDDPKANEFMKALNTWTTQQSKKMSESKMSEGYNIYSRPIIDTIFKPMEYVTTARGQADIEYAKSGRGLSDWLKGLLTNIHNFIGPYKYIDGEDYKMSESINETTAWDVYLRGRIIDTVFMDDDMEEWEVKDGLINHDGYDPGIEVRKSR